MRSHSIVVVFALVAILAGCASPGHTKSSGIVWEAKPSSNAHASEVIHHLQVAQSWELGDVHSTKSGNAVVVSERYSRWGGLFGMTHYSMAAFIMRVTFEEQPNGTLDRVQYTSVVGEDTPFGSPHGRGITRHLAKLRSLVEEAAGPGNAPFVPPPMESATKEEFSAWVDTLDLPLTR